MSSNSKIKSPAIIANSDDELNETTNHSEKRATKKRKLSNESTHDDSDNDDEDEYKDEGNDEFDDDSDGDEEKSGNRKGKGTTKKAEKVKMVKGSQGELYCNLGDQKKRVTVRKWKGKTYVDIREFYEQDGDLKPGKKGISLTLEQYIKLKEVLPAVDDAINSI